MGCVQGSSVAKTEESKKIDELLKAEQKAPPNTKVLLLGTGEAGKTYVRFLYIFKTFYPLSILFGANALFRTFLKQIIFLTKEGDVKDDHRYIYTDFLGVVGETCMEVQF